MCWFSEIWSQCEIPVPLSVSVLKSSGMIGLSITQGRLFTWFIRLFTWFIRLFTWFIRLFEFIIRLHLRNFCLILVNEDKVCMFYNINLHKLESDSFEGRQEAYSNNWELNYSLCSIIFYIFCWGLFRYADEQASWNDPLQFFFSGHLFVSQGHKAMSHSTPMSTINMKKMK